MNRRDKDIFIEIGFIVSMVVVVFATYYGARFIDYVYAGIIIALLEVFVIIPRIVKMYYKIFGQEIGMQAYIPIFNELCMYSPVMAKISLVLWVLIAITAGISFIRNDVYESIFGLHFALNSTMYVMQFCAFLILIQSVIRGIAMCSVSNKIYKKYAEFYNVRNKIGFTRILQYVTFFVPLMRTASFALLYDKLYVLTKMNTYTNKKTKKKLKEERVDGNKKKRVL